MKNIFIYIFLVLLCLMGVLRISAENSIDNLVTSIAPSVFELSCNIDDDKIETNDMITLDKEKFIDFLECHEARTDQECEIYFKKGFRYALRFIIECFNEKF